MPSYSPVFSVQLILYAASTPNTSFEVPAGYTAVVRDIQAYSEAGGTGVRAFLQSGGDGPPIYFATLNAIGLNVSAQWQGRVVAQAGDLLEIDVAELGAEDTVYVGGYLLRNVLA